MAARRGDGWGARSAARKTPRDDVSRGVKSRKGCVDDVHHDDDEQWISHDGWIVRSKAHEGIIWRYARRWINRSETHGVGPRSIARESRDGWKKSSEQAHEGLIGARLASG